MVVKNRTITINHDKNDCNKKIFDFMCKISKNIYNTTLFTANIFFTFKNNIYNDVFNLKKIKKIDNNAHIESNLYIIFQKYFDFYCINKTDINNN